MIITVVSPLRIKKVGVSRATISRSREAFSLYEAVESSAEFLRPAGLVKVNIYEDANHRHRSSRLVNQLRRRGFVFTPEGHPSSLSSTLRKHVASGVAAT